MYSKTPPNRIKKRPLEELSTERPRRSLLDEDVDRKVSDAKVVSMTPRINMNKRARDGSGTNSREVVRVEDDSCEQTRVFKFRVLLPNGTSVELKMTELRSEISIEEFISTVQREYSLLMNQKKSLQLKRRINWEYQDMSFTDANSNKIRLKVEFCKFTRNTWHLLWLHDGSAEPEEYEDMWDLTPDTDLLRELPDDYTCETALADLIDNSLQALWSNAPNSRRLISVEMRREKISIFDSGPGMDGANGTLVKWGKMGASLHRTVREKAIGGEPPYLVPFFGMFGYGGPVATMCLGSKVLVSSKTKRSKKVFTMHMEREALVSASSTDNCWKTKGGVRDPLENEMLDSPHGSFTLVEIFSPKAEITALSIRKLRYKLKDIYFPYIQCDEMLGKTSRPVEFQVNGKDLAEIQGGEVATTNLLSSNGPDFVVQLHFSIRPESSSMAGQNQRVPIEANARLKCVYFPIVEGEENIKRILDKLDKDGCGIGESFDSFSRVSIRRLGRLLPDTRWALLPFMEPKQKRGEKTHIMKRLCSRVKCFIDTDSGFNPTPHKTDLAHQNPYTKALRNFGNNRSLEEEKEVHVEITRDGNKLTLPQLQKLYVDWISEMHDRYDEETSDGLDQPVIVVDLEKIKELEMTSDAMRVHKEIQRKGRRWTAGQNIKVLKGACAKCHKSNVFATLEYIVLEGLSGEASGEARLICRPVGVPENRGCRLSLDKGLTTVDFNESLVFPIRVIDSEKCIPIDDIEWAKKVESVNQKLPDAIEILSRTDCPELEIDEGLLVSVEAGDAPPDSIVAVIRPKSFIQGSSSKRSDQKFIVRINNEMTLEIKRGDTEEHIYSVRIPASSYKGLHGLYIFQLGTKWPKLFQKPGNLRFSFSVAELKDITLEHVVQIRASAEVGRWKVVNPDTNGLYTARVGSACMPLSIACYDRHKKLIQFKSIPKLVIKLISSGKTLAHVRNEKVDITLDKSTLKIKEFLFYSRELDTIRPNYEATLHISTLDDAFSAAFPCRVAPGAPRRIIVHPTNVHKRLLPGQIIEELSLEVFDEYGNHVEKHESILLRLNGFTFKDRSGITRREGRDYMMKVDAKGYVDLSNVLKVSKGYGKDVVLSVISEDEVIFELRFCTEKRELRAVQKEFKNCEGGSLLENIAFEIVDSEGKVDETINSEEKHGQSHTLEIKSTSICIDDSQPIRFRWGRVTIPHITLPDKEGVFFFSAVHSRYPELNCNTKVSVMKTRRDSVTNHEAKRLSSNEPRRSSDILQSQVVDNASQIPGRLSGSAFISQKVPFEKAREENHDSASNHEDVGSPIQSTRRSSEHEQTLVGSPSLNVPFEKTWEENHESSINHEDVGNSILSTRRSSEHEQTLLGSPSLKVPFEKTRKANHDSAINHEDVGSSILSPCRISSGYEQTLMESPSLKTQEKNNGSVVNHKDVGSPILSTKGSSEHGHALLVESPSFKVSQVMNQTFSPHSTKGLGSPASASSTFKTPNMEHTNAQGGSSGSALISLEELINDVINSKRKMTNHVTKLETLNTRQSELEHEISVLKVLIGPDLSNSPSKCGQKSILEQIKSRSRSAAAVICEMPEEELRRRDIVGVVALLGTVRSIELSRMLAQYLGEDQMLAIVCRSNGASYSLDTNMLDKFATELGLSLDGGFLAFCLEDIRPSLPLPLQPPTLPNGITPQGFLGHAVNLINIEPVKHYLREALFYRLFGELQVYENRECMMAAQSCIKAGAVSLDGGMMRGNGLICIGHWEPKILFPVKTSVSSLNLRRMETLEKLEVELVKVKQLIDVEGEASRRATKQHDICLDKYRSCESQSGSDMHRQV